MEKIVTIRRIVFELLCFFLLVVAATNIMSEQSAACLKRNRRQPSLCSCSKIHRQLHMEKNEDTEEEIMESEMQDKMEKKENIIEKKEQGQDRSTKKKRINQKNGRKKTNTKEENLIDKLKQDMECVIFTQMYVASVTLCCGHSFCYMCLKEYMEQSSNLQIVKCPICRSKNKVPAIDRDISINFALQSLIEKVNPYSLDEQGLIDYKQIYQQYLVCFVFIV
ncbi:hypothetical protein RFI_01043, partial [Reticulomyxa filosa]